MHSHALSDSNAEEDEQDSKCDNSRIPGAGGFVVVDEGGNSEGKIVERLCETTKNCSCEEDLQIHRLEGGNENFFKHIHEIYSRLVVKDFEGVYQEDNVDEPHIIPQVVEMILAFEILESVKDIHQKED